MSKIKSVHAREILDSRGNPTLETKVELESGETGLASVPSGASTGNYEAFELRDGDPKRYSGMGVLKALGNVNNFLAPKIIGADCLNQKEIDFLMIELDGTDNKKRLGGNAILSVSLAVCKAAAAYSRQPLYAYLAKLSVSGPPEAKMPMPTFNIINGGKHGAGNLDFQEFHVIPPNTYSFTKALETGEEIYQALKKVLIYRNAIHSIGDEGGFAPDLLTNIDAIELLLEAISSLKQIDGRDVRLGLDAAAGSFFANGYYRIKDKPEPLSREELIDFYRQINKRYHLLLLEDPLNEDDWEGWSQITKQISDGVLVIGDDLLATNPTRLQKALDLKACGGILVKPNQIGTLTQTLEVVKMAQNHRLKISVSHRSGETNDSFIADFAVGIKADFVKFGAPARGERVAKYNRLLEIEDELLS